MPLRSRTRGARARDSRQAGLGATTATVQPTNVQVSESPRLLVGDIGEGVIALRLRYRIKGEDEPTQVQFQLG